METFSVNFNAQPGKLKQDSFPPKRSLFQSGPFQKDRTAITLNQHGCDGYWILAHLKSPHAELVINGPKLLEAQAAFETCRTFRVNKISQDKCKPWFA